jgi:rhodanese-related sulfurtransferase
MPPASPAVGELSPTEFAARRAAGDNLFLLDVREPGELVAASVAGAVHIPMGEVPARLAELPRDREVVVMCHAGGRSLRVAHFLASQGFGPVHNLAGGIMAWADELGLDQSC